MTETSPTYPRQVCPAGELPSAFFEQRETWVDTGGWEWPIDSMDEDMVLFVLDYLMANSSRLRIAWSMELQRTYDTDERHRRWMLNRPAVRALIARLALLDAMPRWQVGLVDGSDVIVRADDEYDAVLAAGRKLAQDVAHLVVAVAEHPLD